MSGTGKKSPSSIRILGIDPGTKKTGYGIIEKNGNNIRCISRGNINIDSKTPLPLRLHDIFNDISNLIECYHPDVIAVEEVFVARNPKTSIKLGQAQGVVLLKAAQLGLKVVRYSPTEVKEALTGYGNASKEQMHFMVKSRLKIKEDIEEDASDALAVAVCHSQHSRYAELMSGVIERENDSSS